MAAAAADPAASPSPDPASHPGPAEILTLRTVLGRGCLAMARRTAASPPFPPPPLPLPLPLPPSPSPSQAKRVEAKSSSRSSLDRRTRSANAAAPPGPTSCGNRTILTVLTLVPLLAAARRTVARAPSARVGG